MGDLGCGEPKTGHLHSNLGGYQVIGVNLLRAHGENIPAKPSHTLRFMHTHGMLCMSMTFSASLVHEVHIRIRCAPLRVAVWSPRRSREGTA